MNYYHRFMFDYMKFNGSRWQARKLIKQFHRLPPPQQDLARGRFNMLMLWHEATKG